MSKQTLGWIIGVFVLFPIFVFLYNKITVRKNDGAKFFSAYYKKIITIRLDVPKLGGGYSDTLNVEFDHYRVGASPIGYKSLSVNIIGVRFFDLNQHKFYKIRMYDIDKQNQS